MKWYGATLAAAFFVQLSLGYPANEGYVPSAGKTVRSETSDHRLSENDIWQTKDRSNEDPSEVLMQYRHAYAELQRTMDDMAKTRAETEKAIAEMRAEFVKISKVLAQSKKKLNDAFLYANNDAEKDSMVDDEIKAVVKGAETVDDDFAASKIPDDQTEAGDSAAESVDAEEETDGLTTDENEASEAQMVADSDEDESQAEIFADSEDDASEFEMLADTKEDDASEAEMFADDTEDDATEAEMPVDTRAPASEAQAIANTKEDEPEVPLLADTKSEEEAPEAGNVAVVSETHEGSDTKAAADSLFKRLEEAAANERRVDVQTLGASKDADQLRLLVNKEDSAVQVTVQGCREYNQPIERFLHIFGKEYSKYLTSLSLTCGSCTTLTARGRLNVDFTMCTKENKPCLQYLGGSPCSHKLIDLDIPLTVPVGSITTTIHIDIVETKEKKLCFRLTHLVKETC